MERLYIWLSLIEGVGNVRINSLVESLGGIINIYNADLKTLLSVKGIGEKTARDIIKSRDLKRATLIYNYCLKNNIKILCRECDTYIKKLLKYKDAPSILYMMGQFKEGEIIGVVGSRQYDSYGKGIAMNFAKRAAINNVNLISGVDSGLDSVIQGTVIKNKGYSIAVLASGIDIATKTEMRYRKEIIKNGMVISNFPIGMKPLRENFIKRNKLIAMLSDKILVVQCHEKSGALNIGKWGLEEGKEVYAVPGDISNDLNKGTNKLIREKAKIYLEPSDLIEYKEKIEKVVGLEARILNSLKLKEKSLDQLAMELKIDLSKVVETLLNLELSEKIIEQNGFYSKS